MTTLEKTLRWIVLGGAFLLPFVPLIVADGGYFPYNLFFPYITGKNFTFRLIVEIMAGAWLALALVNSHYRPRRSWVLGALAVFVAVIAAADIFGVHPFKSIWSNFERMDGLVTLLHLLAYTVIAASVITKEKLWKWLFWVSLGVSVYLALYGVLQIAGFSALGEGGAAGLGARIDATFGNPIYLAAYMLFHIFIAAMLWAQMWSERRSGERLPLSLLYGAIIVLDTFALLFTGTRGTIIGLIGGTFVAAALVLLQARNSKTAWRVSVATVVAVLLMGAGVWLVRGTEVAQKVIFLDRLSTISLSDATVKARFLNWSIAWQGVKERPILGWGQENYAIVFDKYYDPRMYGQEPWFDRVHNIVFDWLVAGGFLGLISYLGVFAAALWALWRGSGFSVAERSILIGLLLAYFTHNFFVFDNVTSYILFGTVLAYIAHRSAASSGAKTLFERPTLPASALPYVALVAAVVIWGVAWGVNGRALAANRLLLTGLGQQQSGVLTNLAYFKEAIALHTYGTQEAREQLSQGASRIAASELPNDIKQKFFDAATREMQAQAMESPLDARFPLFLGVTRDAFGDYAGAAIALQKAHELSPKKQTIYFEMAQNASLRGDIEAALGYLKDAHELAPEIKEPRFYYAAALIRAGKGAEAEELIAPYISSGDAADTRILAAYVARKEYAKAVPLWQARINSNPQDAQAYFTLAAIYYEAGDTVRAIATLEEAKRVIPAVTSQADPLIQQLRSGTVKRQ